MHEIFVNLKRFEVPRALGGVCPREEPGEWIREVIDQCVEMGLGAMEQVRITFLLPEALILSATSQLAVYPSSRTKAIEIGCQGVFREDIEPGGNFGAFTTNFPAKAARNLGCTCSIIGHSEERKDKLGILQWYEVAIKDDAKLRSQATRAVNEIINAEVLRALDAGLNVLLCVGETAEERGGGDFEEQRPRIEAVLREQLVSGLKGTGERLAGKDIVIDYEPVWAIGPGKVPPGKDYIHYVSRYIKSVVKEEFGRDIKVVYGGGLKKENAGMIGSIETIDGGLVALTRFSGEIGFEPQGLKEIIEEYLG